MTSDLPHNPVADQVDAQPMGCTLLSQRSKTPGKVAKWPPPSSLTFGLPSPIWSRPTSFTIWSCQSPNTIYMPYWKHAHQLQYLPAIWQLHLRTHKHYQWHHIMVPPIHAALHVLQCWPYWYRQRQVQAIYQISGWLHFHSSCRHPRQSPLNLEKYDGMYRRRAGVVTQSQPPPMSSQSLQ